MKAQTALVRMFESLDENSPVRLYLSSHCTNDLMPLTGDTGMSTGILSAKSIADSPNTHSLADGAGVASTYPGAGIYAFVDPETGHMNIGSCTKFLTRLSNHFSDSKDISDGRPLYSRARELGGLHSFN